MGVVRVNNKAELQAAYERVAKEMAGVRIEAGAIVTSNEEGVSTYAHSCIFHGLRLEACRCLQRAAGCAGASADCPTAHLLVATHCM